MSTEEETQADDESFGSITPEFIAHLNSELGTPFLRNRSTPNKSFLRRIGGKRTREDVTSRSRTEIINWVLESAELIKVCICPYCLKIHSRRDNTRVHIKKDHKGWEVREFIEGVDANLDHVRRVNEIGKFTVPPPPPPPPPQWECNIFPFVFMQISTKKFTEKKVFFKENSRKVIDGELKRILEKG
ncbi:Protein CBG12382 [Caenorhabditis briggsae]|uniref:Protein CBG12382 n=1 Tax=Caenorhabditis briggsae TaxID=6238 RepID=A8XFA9_CAEBR|nr:Protein CBG12382 [Caenorhabditis briggsae]CAP31370.2 Protein CBG12382 [Caenorhabditis briggsae]